MELRHSIVLFTMAAITAVSFSSCSVTRRIPEGSYLLKRNVVEIDRETPRDERIKVSELNRYIQQTPNKKFLGTNFNAWLYAQANPEKNGWWHRTLRRLGGEPEVWDPRKTELSDQYIETYMASRGYFESEAWYSVDTLKRRKVIVRYGERQGTPWRIRSIGYDFRDRPLEGVVMRDSLGTLLHEGGIFDINVLDAERGRIATDLKNRGYYDFDIGNITYTADSTRGDHLVDLTMIIHRHLEGYRDDGTPYYENSRVFRIRDIYVYPDYNPLADYRVLAETGRLDTIRSRGFNIVFDSKLKIRPGILQKSIKFNQDHIYNARQVSATSAELMRLGAFRSVSLLFDRSDNPPPDSETAVPESYLRCDIRCVPALRQNYRVDLEGSTSSSFYGLRATLGYQNRNLFRGAELFDVSLMGGFEFLKSKTTSRKMSYEVGVAVSLTYPRFESLWNFDKHDKARNPQTKFTLSANWQDRVYYSRALFGFNLAYSWGFRRFESLSVRPIDISVVGKGHMNPEFEAQLQNPYLRASYDNQLIAGISMSYVFNNQPRDLNAGAVVIRVNAETTGNLLSGLVHWWSRPAADGSYNIMGIPFSQYLRGDLSFSQKIVLGEKASIAYRVMGGAIYSYGNNTVPPIDKKFFAGGVNSMRGWGVRTLGAGSQLYDPENDVYPAQTGDMKLEANIEARFPIWNIFRGAVFFDAGNVWNIRTGADTAPETVFQFKNFHKQLGFNTGLGLRLDIRVATLRLDWGVQLHNPNRPVGERWIHNFKWANTALNFGVGYPF